MSCHLGKCGGGICGGSKLPPKTLSSEQKSMLGIQLLSFVIINSIAIKVMPKVYSSSFALGFSNELFASFKKTRSFTLFSKVENRWSSSEFLNDCGGGCASLIGVISGLNVSKIQGFILGSAFYASHISHQATILCPATGFVAGQQAASLIAEKFIT